MSDGQQQAAKSCVLLGTAPRKKTKIVLKWHMNRTGIPHDTWEEEALQKVKWSGLLRKATSAVEEQRQQEYQCAHDRRHSAAALGIFQLNN